MKIRKKTNPVLTDLIDKLILKSREEGVQIWRDVAKRLNRPTRQRVAVNISKLNRYVRENELAIVPGKVLGSGTIEHPITVSSFGFSELAYDKITNAKGRCLTIEEFMGENPKGSGVKIIQ
ncbi:MAG: 50S ribosomal protein L18e [Candidatus Methanolliviera sp. GoM_oil]|nr:MAG: 50S ribosomal protein L18e [Candidatus Methanolliviera sp. GoM_oil]